MNTNKFTVSKIKLNNTHNFNVSVLLIPILFFYLISIFYAPLLLPGRNFAYSYLPAWIFSFVTVLVTIYKGYFRFNPYILFYFLFSVLCLVSVYWSVDPSTTFNRAARVVSIALVLPGIWFFCSSKKRIDIFMRLYILAAATAVVSGFLFNWSAADRQFLGVSSSKVVFLYGVAAIISFLGWVVNNKKSWLLFIPIFMAPIVAVGSIKGTIWVLGVFASFLIMEFVRNLFSMQLRSLGKRTILFLVFLLGLIIFVQSNPATLTKRINRNVTTLNHVIEQSEHNEAASAAGAGQRLILFQKGISYLNKNLTLFGEGLDASYSIYEGLIGKRVYSHTTFIDLLMGVGLLGTLIFYAIFFYFLGCLYIDKKIDKKIRNALLVTIIWMLILSIVGRIYSNHELFMLLIISSAIYRQSRYDEKIKNKYIVKNNLI